MQFKDKVVVITGASSGIGKELSFQFAKKGAKVVLAARSKEALEENARLINGAGGEARAVPTDVSDRSQVKNLVDKTIQEFGCIDVFISNAGVTHAPLDFLDLAESDFRRVMETNLMGCVYGTQLAAPVMEKTGGGLLVFISSIVGKRGIPQNSAYCASKFALQGLTESIRPELKKKNIRVVNICPPGVETPFFINNNRGTARRYKLHPVEKIAKLIIEACEKEKREELLTWNSKVLAWGSVLFPGILDWIIPIYNGGKQK